MMSRLHAAVLGVVLPLAGCAHAEATKTAAPARSGAPDRIAVLEGKLAERERQLGQLENRMALIEAEQRQMRYALAEQSSEPPIGIRETVRIGKAKAQPDDFDEWPRSTEEKAASQRHEQRPILRLVGERRRDRTEPAQLMPIPDVSERLPIAPVPAQAPTMDPERQYARALDFVRKRNFVEALAALTEFLVQHPDSPRASRAMFWRAQVLFAQHDYERALDAFETALLRDPAGEQAADALLRVALCHRRLGAPERARAALERLKAQFPESDAAKIAAQEDA